MKRALAVLLAFVGFSAFGIGTFSGKWETTVSILSSPALDATTLTLNYTDFGMTFTSVSTFKVAGFTSQEFKLSGYFGPFELTGNMVFVPATEDLGCIQTWSVSGPHYKSASLTSKLEFGGLKFTLAVAHYANYVMCWKGLTQTDYNNLISKLQKCYDKYYLVAVADGQCQTPSVQDKIDYCIWFPDYMTYTLTADLDPFSIKLVFDDVSTGIQFSNLVATVKNIGLCCGISLTATFAFNKCDGFDYLSFSGIEIPLCCGVSLTASIKFTTTGKTVTTGLTFAGFGDACFTVYADARKDGNAWTGIDVYGWKIKCSLGDCSYVEFLTALNVTKVEAIVGDIFQGNEFEYMKLGFCGAGCCGGNWTVALAVYFQQTDSLFGITRIGADMSIPIMSNLTFTVKFTSTPTLKVGWTFTF